jgi:hypothetical protein
MKSRHIFWGILFLTLGILILINNLATVYINWGFIWNLWPLVLVVIGLYFFVRGTEYKWILVAVIALLLGLFLFAGFKNITEFFKTDYYDDQDFNVEYFQHPYNKDIKTANLYVKSGVGSIRANDTTDELISIQYKGGFGKYTFQHDVYDNNANLYFELEEGHFRWNIGPRKNRIEIKINPNPVWDMDYDVGAEGIDLDLTKFKIANLTFKSGVSWIKVKLGDNYDDTKLKFDSGVSKLTVLVPKDAGCEINARTELTKKRFPGFDRIDSQTYRTENYYNAGNKISIDIKADVSNVKVERY